jgi:general stress protein CsbA
MNDKKEEPNKLFALFTAYSHWIATFFLILGFVVMSINDKDGFGKSFHQLTLAPLFLIAGYGLFIFVIMRKIKD